MPTHRGSCHCGAVVFEVDAPEVLDALACNCSICKPCGYVQHIVPRSRLRILQGLDMLTTYTFNTHVAKHTFCKRCGVKPFYTPRSNPDGYAVNVHCLEPTHIREIRVEPFDGESWEQHAGALAGLSREEPATDDDAEQ
jgi:hypothetical protein